MAHGNRLSIATHEARRRNQECERQLSQPEKVMYRLDRRLRERGIRSYRGCAISGRFFSRMNFQHGFIIIGPFGDLTWRHG
jgi:hypothetical protein